MKSTMTGNWFALGSAKARLCGLLLATICAFAPASAEAAEVYSIAVVPTYPPVTLHAQWTPFLERLTRASGLQFRLKLFQNMSEFEREIAEGNADFVLLSPVQIVVAHQMHGYLPLVRGSAPVSIGLFVRKDSPVKTVDDLADQTISFLGGKALCSVLMKHMLAQQQHKIAYTAEYSGSTSNVIRSVLLGKSAAGSVFLPELEGETKETRDQLRLVVATPEIPPHPLSAHPRVAREAREAVKKAVLEMAASKDGAELLKTVRLPAPVAADYARDYQSLEIVDVKGLTNWGK